MLLSDLRFARNKVPSLHRSSHIEEIPCFSKLAVIAGDNRRHNSWSRQCVHDIIEIVCDIVGGHYTSGFKPLHPLATEDRSKGNEAPYR